MKPVKFSTFFFTLLVGLIFQLYPWSNAGIIVRPDFLLVIMLYWLLQAPYHCNIGWVWFAGLLVDLSTGSLLGQHALTFAITAFLGLIYQRRLVLFNRWQLYLYVLFLFGVERGLILLLKLFAGGELPDWTYAFPIVSDLILWQFMIIWFGELTRPKKL
ncbi:MULTISPECIES: rod shape-determining protein MreD [unclassified Methylophilus]|jgi:rod shape-determining protein MreD|uniref:Rod shape-determining protein MreD n=1 Tax=Methylophilus glucosoxydans TaxID=752553 RepID=A0ABW3GF56_9PROT|nr:MULTISPECIES: rod shape-determining protein MreD [unclassified Methylophilus]MBF5040001.1 rod shape-determining protein MreD [Methylophilus sp. 13]MDF0378930.1 rod shape-determining protein MreD [Methylophilus sp. YYY-1]MDT7848512.1 rod shape-determining protein MreD [Methylophilus sp. VKM B-3414]BEV06772.1 rod shape-determining protein MreD [Methylophilus sp. DW102]